VVQWLKLKFHGTDTDTDTDTDYLADFRVGVRVGPVGLRLKAMRS